MLTDDSIGMLTDDSLCLMTDEHACSFWMTRNVAMFSNTWIYVIRMGKKTKTIFVVTLDCKWLMIGNIRMVSVPKK
jgi:hypothetical protein